MTDAHQNDLECFELGVMSRQQYEALVSVQAARKKAEKKALNECIFGVRKPRATGRRLLAEYAHALCALWRDND